MKNYLATAKQAAALLVKLQLLAVRAGEAAPMLLPQLAALAPALREAAAQLQRFLPLSREAGAAVAAAQSAHEQASQQQVSVTGLPYFYCGPDGAGSCHAFAFIVH